MEPGDPNSRDYPRGNNEVYLGSLFISVHGVLNTQKAVFFFFFFLNWDGNSRAETVSDLTKGAQRITVWSLGNFPTAEVRARLPGARATVLSPYCQFPSPDGSPFSYPTPALSPLPAAAAPVALAASAPR